MQSESEKVGVAKKGGILLVILFPHDVAAVTVWDSRESWAFNEGTFEAQFSALGD
jgi:hypothetical protein